MASKQLWEGHFNIYNEDKYESAEAYSEEQAKLFMARKIAKSKGVNPGVIFNYFQRHPHCCEIKVKS